MSDNTKIYSSNNHPVEFDIYGMAGVRLINPSPADAEAVTRQLGPLHAVLEGEPDITIQFVEEIPTPTLNYLGLDFVGFDEEGLYILKSKKARAKVRIPFEQIGQPLEILCETGLRRVPLLTAVINLAMIRKGHIPLHAAGFEYHGAGVLVTGWSKGGKTEALLSFADHGARYVGDEWVFLSADGQRMFGLTEPIHVWDWQTKYLTRIKPPVKREKKILFKMIRSLDRVNRMLSRRGWNRAFPLKILDEAMPAFKRQLHVTLPPQTIFEKEKLRRGAPVDKIFYVGSWNRPEIRVEPFDAREIAGRMAHSNRFELMPFFEYYHAFRFAFPERENPFLETVHERHAELLLRALEGKEAYRVLHPYPVSLTELFRSMEPFCQANIVVEKNAE